MMKTPTTCCFQVLCEGQESTNTRGQGENVQIAKNKSNMTSKFSLANLPPSLKLAYQSYGVVYGDLSTSPLYVYKCIFVGKLQDHQDPETIFGAFSLIFWTLTLIPLLKYIIIILSADDNGEGETFALYSLLCRHGKFSLLPNQQAADEELSAYKYGGQSLSSLELKRFLEKHKKLRTGLLLVVLLGASMVIGDGVITPAMSVKSSLSGLQDAQTRLSPGGVLSLSCVILIGLFALQHFGTHKVGFLFAPVVMLWLISIFVIGLYNTFAFVFLVYPCLVVQYMGQAAFLSKNISSIPNSFYGSIPGDIFWPVFVIATLAAIVASQAMISATFSIIKQCHAIGCFPRVKVVHTSKQIHGQIYIPEINWILMILTLAVAIGFHDTTTIGNAYGLAVMSLIFITTFLVALVMPHAQKFLEEDGYPLYSLSSSRPLYSCGTTELSKSTTSTYTISALCLTRGTLPYWSGLPRPYRMYRCIVRYGYKDLQGDDGNFENHLIQSIAEFIQMEGIEPRLSSPDSVSNDGRMAVISSRTFDSSESSLIAYEVEESGASTITLQSLKSVFDDENPHSKKRQMRFQIPKNPEMDPSVKEELLDLIQAKEAGVAYIVGHSYIRARRSSSFFKKLVIDFGYSFLRKNCRGPAVGLHITHISLIEVGMIYHI
ncbi:hypothetical protein RD792_009764 [Penstemon davidsonii]|uniref:Potassium transporter n=1 Tax=Penstemon davidsonii TaxID=160366 RepID=A0ABR0D056_9LAMI|nr:hypothetical protein RD792_009764 [Penstemon davidsonii]